MNDEILSDKRIVEVVKKLREAAGANIESAILFGSAVAGDFHPEYSNLNLFCVLRDSSFAALMPLVPAVKWWNAQKQPAPLFMTRDEITRSTDVFTIEFLDIKQHHRVLFGEDVFENLTIPPDLHRVQVEYELREKLALLRQHLLLAAEDEKRLWELLLRSVSSFTTLFRHALIVLGQDARVSKKEAVVALSERLGFDASAILEVLQVREGKAARKQFKLPEVFSRYLVAVEQVTAAVDKILDSGKRGAL